MCERSTVASGIVGKPPGQGPTGTEVDPATGLLSHWPGQAGGSANGVFETEPGRSRDLSQMRSPNAFPSQFSVLRPCVILGPIDEAGGLTQALAVGRRVTVAQTAWTAEMLWELFEATGSIWAYLIYRRFAAFRKASLKISLN